MEDEKPHRGIDMARIPVGAGVAGVVFTLGSMLVFLLGVPGLWYFFALAIGLGLGIAVILHFTDRAR